MKKVVLGLYRIREPFDEFNFFKMICILSTLFLVFAVFFFPLYFY
jgi:hypothetical protein